MSVCSEAAMSDPIRWGGVGCMWSECDETACDCVVCVRVDGTRVVQVEPHVLLKRRKVGVGVGWGETCGTCACGNGKESQQ